MVVPPRATERVWGTDTIAGAGAGAVEPGAGLPCTLLGSRPGCPVDFEDGHIDHPGGSSQADGARADESGLFGKQGVFPTGKGDGVGIKGIFQTAWFIGHIGGNFCGVPTEQNEGSGWIVRPIGDEAGMTHPERPPKIIVVNIGGA